MLNRTRRTASAVESGHRWLRGLGLASLKGNGIGDAQSHGLVDDFLARSHSLAEEFLRRVDLVGNPQALAHLERQRFLGARGSIPLDPANQVNGSVMAGEAVLAGGLGGDGPAAVLYAALQAWRRLVDERAGSVTDLMGVTRLPAPDRDRLERAEAPTEVLLLYRSRLRLLQVLEDGALLPFARIAAAIRAFRREVEQQAPTALPVLTALAKDQAVDGLEAAHDCRPEIMAAIDNALMAFSLDAPLAGADGRADLALGLTGCGDDRWFGKSNLLIDTRGFVGFYFDHAVADGALIMRFVHAWLRAAAGSCLPDPAVGAAAPAACRPVPRFPEALEQEWSLALQGYRAEAARLQARQLAIALEGASCRKLAAAIPLACQGAYRRLTGRLEDPYVPVTRGHKAERGLDFIHGSAPGTEGLLAALEGRDPLDPEALDQVLGWWRRTFLRTMLGPGGQRFMHYLYAFARERGLDGEPLFAAAGYPDRLAYPRLCLSVVAGQPTMPGPVFPPIREGWSIGAITHERGGNLTIAAWDGAADEAAEAIDCVLGRIFEGVRRKGLAAETELAAGPA